MTPTVILLPGLQASGELFEPLLKVMPPEVPQKVIAHPTGRACSMNKLFALMELQLAGAGDMILVAESFSGPLALRFANAHPGRVKGIVLCVSFIYSPVPELLCYLAMPLILLGCPIPEMAIRIFLAGGGGAEQTLVSEVRRVIRANNWWALAWRVQQAAWIDAGDDLRRCQVPLLCIAAKRDRLVGARSVRRIRRIRPDILVRTIDGPHLLLQLKPREVWREIQQFMQSLACLQSPDDPLARSPDQPAAFTAASTSS